MVLETEPTIISRTPGVHLDVFSTSERLLPRDMLKAPASVDDCLEIVVAWIEQTAGKSYFIRPLEEFQVRYGKVNPEDEFYQARMNYFLEHCVLERPMTGGAESGLAPVTRFFEGHGAITKNLEDGAATWMNFSGFRHGVFQVLKSGAEMMMVKDLITDRSFKIVPKANETLQYVSKKSIFQCFVFGNFDRKYLGQGLIVHPEGANPEILNFFKKYKKYPNVRPSEVLRNLALTNMRFLRMQHVDPAVIYRNLSS